MTGTLARCPFSQFKTVLSHPALVGSLTCTTIDQCPFLKRIATSVVHAKETPAPPSFSDAEFKSILKSSSSPLSLSSTVGKEDRMEVEPFGDVFNDGNKFKLSFEPSNEELFKDEFVNALDKIKEEGRYRVFNNIERKAGKYVPITVIILIIMRIN